MGRVERHSDPGMGDNSMKGKRVSNKRGGEVKASRRASKLWSRYKRPKCLRSIPEGQGSRGIELWIPAGAVQGFKG